MYKSMKKIAAGAGFAAVLAAGLSVAAHSSDYSTSTFTSSSGAGDTITMGPETTTLETPSFKPAAKAEVPCGFYATGSC